jgi:competence protein ComEC
MRLFVAAFVLGTAVLQREPRLPEFPFLPAGLAALAALALVPRGVMRLALATLAGAALGHGLAAWRAEARLEEALPLSREAQDVAVRGVVASLPQVTARGTRFLFHVEDPAFVPGVVSLMWYAEAAAAPPPKLVAGDRWALTVRLRRPRGLANPHTFDFEPWALERGIRATGYVRSKSPAARDPLRVEGWPYSLHRWRGAIRDAMEGRLGDARLRGVLVALAIGDQDAVASDDWDVFWRTGVGHLMSISGLHITMLAALAFAMASFAWRRIPALALRWPARKAAVVAGVLAALAYTLVTGYAVPAQRTFVMLAAVAACVLADRHGSPSRVLALAALAVLLVDPWAVLAGGFWLSFGAVAAIFFALSGRTGRPGAIGAAAREQFAVLVAMLPMLLALFQEMSLVSPLANAIAIPLVSLVVVPLTLGGAFLPLPWLLDAAHVLMSWLMIPLEALAALPGAVMESHEPAGWTVAAAALGCAWLLAPRGVPMRGCGAVWIAPIFLVAPAQPPPGGAWIDVLDVGQGLAVVVRTAGHALVFDAGPAWGGDADSGARIVVPYLRGEGVAVLDGLLVSHADDDHSGGAIEVAWRRQPYWLLSSLPRDDPLHGLAERSTACRAGQRWTWDGVAFEMLHPAQPRIAAALPARKENDWSCVLRVRTAGGSALLTADIEARSERELAARAGAALAADVLLVPHHGSRTSSTEAFIDAVAPRDAIFTVGYRNRFRHPHEAVMQRYVARGIRAWRSDRDGALRITLPAAQGEAVEVRRLVSRRAYWSDREP